MELQLVMTILASITAFAAIILASYGIIIIKSMERSTHTVTWQTANPNELDETARLNDEYNKRLKEDAELHDIGF